MKVYYLCYWGCCSFFLGVYRYVFWFLLVFGWFYLGLRSCSGLGLGCLSSG